MRREIGKFISTNFKEHIGENRRKKLKNVVLKGISEELEMPIANWDEPQSDRDYNAYSFSYTSVFEIEGKIWELTRWLCYFSSFAISLI